MIVKVCGITRDVDIPPAIAAGATHLGLIFAEGSTRQITTEEATILRRVIPEGVEAVGVFRNQSLEEVLATAQAVGLQWIQLHGGFAPEAIATLQGEGYRVIWATAVSVDGSFEEPSVRPDLLLLDTATKSGFGGTGTTFAWGEARRPSMPFLVAGGIKPMNVRRAIQALRPDGIDLASGVEAAPGIKSHALLRELGHALQNLSTHDADRAQSNAANSEV